jgi:Transposase
MGRRGYSPEFRRKVLDLIDAGCKVADVARDLGISTQTIYNWLDPLGSRHPVHLVGVHAPSQGFGAGAVDGVHRRLLRQRDDRVVLVP